MKKLIRTIIFLGILLTAVLTAQYFLIPFNEQDTNQTQGFYGLKEDSIDVLFVGTSPVLVGISPLDLYHETGISSHVWGSSSQLAEITYLNVKEALKTQSPKLVAVTDRSLLHRMEPDKYETSVRRGMDFKKLTLDKMIAANGVVKESEWQSLISYAFPILRYHSRWSAVLSKGLPDEQGDYDYMHGQYPVYKTKKITFFKNEETENDKDFELDPSAVYWYEKLADLCHENDIELIFIEMPTKSIRTYAKNRKLRDFTSAHDIGLLDFNVGTKDPDDQSEPALKDVLGISLETDYYNAQHLNPRGAIKVTRYIGEYLQDNYGLTASDTDEEVRKIFEEDYRTYTIVLKEKGYAE